MDTSPGTSRLMRTLQEVEKTKKRCNNAYRKKAEYVKSRSPIHEWNARESEARREGMQGDRLRKMYSKIKMEN